MMTKLPVGLRRSRHRAHVLVFKVTTFGLLCSTEALHAQTIAEVRYDLQAPHVAVASYDDEPVIYINEQLLNLLPDRLWRFVFAHELAHHALHHVPARERRAHEAQPWLTPEMEREADCAAASVLYEDGMAESFALFVDGPFRRGVVTGAERAAAIRRCAATPPSRFTVLAPLLLAPAPSSPADWGGEPVMGIHCFAADSASALFCRATAAECVALRRALFDRGEPEDCRRVARMYCGSAKSSTSDYVAWCDLSLDGCETGVALLLEDPALSRAFSCRFFSTGRRTSSVGRTLPFDE